MASRGPFFALLTSTFCLMPLAHGAPASDTLYSRLGGSERVDAFVGEAIAHASLPADLKRQFANHICALTGGGCKSPRAPQINEAQFIQLVDLLRASMRAHEVPLAARNELLEVLAPLQRGS